MGSDEAEERVVDSSIVLFVFMQNEHFYVEKNKCYFVSAFISFILWNLALQKQVDNVVKKFSALSYHI